MLEIGDSVEAEDGRVGEVIGFAPGPNNTRIVYVKLPGLLQAIPYHEAELLNVTRFDPVATEALR